MNLKEESDRYLKCQGWFVMFVVYLAFDGIRLLFGFTVKFVVKLIPWTITIDIEEKKPSVKITLGNFYQESNEKVKRQLPELPG